MPFSSSAPRPERLFKSGFESNTTIGSMVNAIDSVSSYYPITGSDVVGSSWPISVHGSDINRISNIINTTEGQDNSVADMNDYFDCHIETVTGHTGSDTSALYMGLTAEPADISQMWLNSQFSVPSSVSDRKLYTEFWMKFPADLITNLGASANFRSIFYCKTENTDYRIEVYVQNNAGTLEWVLVEDSFYNGHTVFYNPTLTNEVPVDEWFCIEWFYKRSAGADGHVWVAINGIDAYERYGPNIGETAANINRIGYCGIYQTIPAAYPAYHLIDDIEIWNDFPNGEGVSTF